MDRGVAIVVASMVGAAVVTQGPLNSQLGRAVGALPASVLALSVSLVALTTLALLTGGLGGLRNVGEAPWYAVVGGGAMGALYVGSIVYTVRALGAGGLTAATISGQLAFAVVIDHYGWLGVARSPITAVRLAGIALLAVGTYLVIKN
jgi:transporter family-2 protein